MKIIETHIVPAISHKIRLQEYAVSIFSNCPTKSALKKAVKKKRILVDGNLAETSVWIEEGMRLDLLQENTEYKIFKLQIEVLFEDEHIAIVNKPPNLPTSGNFFKSLENCLPYNLTKSSEIDALVKPLPSHRLDSPTSGLIICAKTQKALRLLQQKFANNHIEKTYVALVYGKLEKSITVESPIQNKRSKTILSPLKSYFIDKAYYTLVEAMPKTGRTHQIRIHLASLKFPIVGDAIYSTKKLDIFKSKTLFLFSRQVKLSHPITSETLEISLKLPKKFRNLINVKGLD